MPAYTYYCEKCSEYFEYMFVKYEDRDKKRKHDECGSGGCGRVPHTVAVGAEPYRMKAVMGNGEHVLGHFGKSAKRDKGGAKT